MKRLFPILLVGLALAVMAAANGNDEEKPRIKTVGLMGHGLATGVGDPANFELVRAGVARVVVKLGGQEKIVPAGVFFFGEQKFRLRNVAIANKSVSADIYSGNQSIGSLRAELVAKPSSDVWFGKLSLSGTDYNLYILGVRRLHNAHEIGENARELCSENPEECGEFRNASGIGNTCDNLNATNCRDKIKEFCEYNTEDRRCIAIHRVYCTTHLEDSRCRELLKKYCELTQRPDRPEVCERFFEKFSEMKEREEGKGDIREWAMEKREETRKKAMELRERLRERFRVNTTTGETESETAVGTGSSGRGVGTGTQEEG